MERKILWKILTQSIEATTTTTAPSRIVEIFHENFFFRSPFCVCVCICECTRFMTIITMNTMFQVYITAFLFPFTFQSIILEAVDIFHKYHKLHSVLLLLLLLFRVEQMWKLCLCSLKKIDLEQWFLLCVCVFV